MQELHISWHTILDDATRWVEVNPQAEKNISAVQGSSHDMESATPLQAFTKHLHTSQHKSEGDPGSRRCTRPGK
jgi:hypothetical protein